MNIWEIDVDLIYVNLFRFIMSSEMLILGSHYQISLRAVPCQALPGVPPCVPETSALTDPAMGGCECPLAAPFLCSLHELKTFVMSDFF